jgi:hypothetical protein
MGKVYVLYSALAVFGLGVTVIDFLGLMDHAAGHDGCGDQAGDHDGADHDADGGHETDAHHGPVLAPGGAGLRFLTAFFGLLRIGVYFSLGAGPTGLFALFMGLGTVKSLLWSAGAGAGLAVLARLLRRLVRRELDSSIKSGELLMEKAVILIPVAPGKTGKALVRQFGREREIYVRCRDQEAAFAKGSEARIVDADESWFWIEPV